LSTKIPKSVFLSKKKICFVTQFESTNQINQPPNQTMNT